MEAFTIRELKALKGALTGSLSGRSNELHWKAHEHLDLVAKLDRVVSEREASWVNLKTNLESLATGHSEDTSQKETQLVDPLVQPVALLVPE